MKPGEMPCCLPFRNAVQRERCNNSGPFPACVSYAARWFRRLRPRSYFIDPKGYSAATGELAQSCALRRRGRSQNPRKITLLDALDREHENGGRVIWVRRPDAGAHGFGERGPGLDDHDSFLRAFDSALPSVNR